MSEKELKLTDLDYATGDHHLQMVKAALPYLDIGRQRNLSMFVKVEELLRTMESITVLRKPAPAESI